MDTKTFGDATLAYLPANEHGRDFVVGDLHGQVHLLRRLMDHVGFDASTDRVFSAGDLVDRGEDSLHTLALLEEPWFHAVMGNHEQMMLDAYLMMNKERESRFGAYHLDHHPFLNNGGHWLLSLDPVQLRFWEMLMNKYVRHMPQVMVVGQGSPNRFNVVHAELDDNEHRKVVDADLDAGRLFEPGFIHGFDDVGTVADQLMWSRSYTRCGVATVRDGLSPTYCGHSILPKRKNSFRLCESHFNLDAGAYKTTSKGADGEFGLLMVEHGSLDGFKGWFVNKSRSEVVMVSPFSFPLDLS